MIIKTKIDDSGLLGKRLHDQSLSSQLFTHLTSIESPRIAETINELSALFLAVGRNGVKNG